MKDEQDCAEEAEDQTTNDKYRAWKKNSPYLYDLLLSQCLEWPSLAIDWLNSKAVFSDYSLQSLVIATHASGSNKNALSLLSIKLPLEDELLKKSSIDSILSYEPKIKTSLVMNHDGEVNTLRVMPQKDNIIASKGTTGLVYLYDTDKFKENKDQVPDILPGHQKEGLSIAWSTLKEGLLASGSDDHLVCVWDTSTGRTPIILNHHTSLVQDISWSEFYYNTLASVGDDRKIILWDMRQQSPSYVIDAHIHEINSIDFNKHDEYLLATGSSDKTIGVWDIRNMSKKLICLDYHQDSVTKVSWAPFSMSMIASIGNDRKVVLWDLGKTESEYSDETPPEMLFVHSGHTARVTDVVWNPNDHFLMGSVAEDNMLQIWQMSHTLFSSDNIRLGVSDKDIDINYN
jgi:histone-binding protein RBBP4